MAPKKGMKLEDTVVLWRPRNEIIDSEYGEIYYSDWCKNEVSRLNYKNRFRHWVVRRGNQCSIKRRVGR